MSRFGAHKGRTRDETYAELQQHVEMLRQQRDELQRDNDRYEARLKEEATKTRQLMAELRECIENEQLPAKEVSVAEQLQQAVTTMIDEKNSTEQIPVRMKLSSQGSFAGSKPCRFRWAVEVCDEGEGDFDGDLLDKQEWASAIADCEPVPEVVQPATEWPRLRVTMAGVRGVLAVIGDELLWGETGAELPSSRTSLADVTAAAVVSKALSPWKSESHLTICVKGAPPVVFISEWPLARAEAFAQQLRDLASTAAVASAANQHQRAVRLSARVRAGRELYSRLHEIGRLQHDHKMARAAELFAQLQPPPAPTDEKAEARVRCSLHLLISFTQGLNSRRGG